MLLFCGQVDGSEGPSTSGRELGWDDGQLRLLWDSVTRSLLKLGTRGITERHARWVAGRRACATLLHGMH